MRIVMLTPYLTYETFEESYNADKLTESRTWVTDTDEGHIEALAAAFRGLLNDEGLQILLEDMREPEEPTVKLSEIGTPTQLRAQTRYAAELRRYELSQANDVFVQTFMEGSNEGLTVEIFEAWLDRYKASFRNGEVCRIYVYTPEA